MVLYLVQYSINYLKYSKFIKIKVLKEFHFKPFTLKYYINYDQTFMLIFNVAYNLNEGTDFMLYGENVILYIEYIIVLLMFSFYEKVDKFFVIKLTLLLLISSLFLFKIMPIILFKMSIYINMILCKPVN